MSDDSFKEKQTFYFSKSFKSKLRSTLFTVM